MLLALANPQHQQATVADDSDISDDAAVANNVTCEEAVAEALQSLTEALRVGWSWGLQSAWRRLIIEWALGPDSLSLNFPAFARQHLDDALIVKCVRVEFGLAQVDSQFYGKISTSSEAKVAKILGFEDTRMLALLFGADRLRTPSRETWKYLCRYLKSLPENRAQIFLERDYLKLMSDWATRVKLDPDSPRDRWRCVFARQPYQDLKDLDSKAYWLIPRDFPVAKSVPDGSPTPSPSPPPSTASPRPQTPMQYRILSEQRPTKLDTSHVVAEDPLAPESTAAGKDIFKSADSLQAERAVNTLSSCGFTVKDCSSRQKHGQSVCN